MLQLQSGKYESGYFHKIWVEDYCLGKDHASERFYLKFIRCQSPCQQQNLMILLTLWSQNKPCGRNFWNLNFYLRRQSYKYYQEKKSSCAYIIFIHKSYNEVPDKIIAEKTRQK